MLVTFIAMIVKYKLRKRLIAENLENKLQCSLLFTPKLDLVEKIYSYRLNTLLMFIDNFTSLISLINH